jgi:hypothetical protein
LSTENSNIEEDIPFEERDRIWNLIYEKITGSIKEKSNFAILFSTRPGEKEGYSAIITEDQYEILLKGFIYWSEEQERYEICTEANKKLKELESWKKKN